MELCRLSRSGRARRARCDCVRHVVGRLAHRAYDGNADHETQTGRRFLRRDRRRTDARVRHAHRHTRLDNSHDHRLDRRRRRHAQVIRRQVGRRRPHRLGLDPHHPRRRLRRRRFLLDRLDTPQPGKLSHKRFPRHGPTLKRILTCRRRWTYPPSGLTRRG